jgi:uncharacterized protein with HEPN domain
LPITRTILYFDRESNASLKIIGEALNQAIQYDPSVAELISNTSRIISFRNRLIHGYATISDHVVWGVLETNLPVLNREVKALLETAED